MSNPRCVSRAENVTADAAGAAVAIPQVTIAPSRTNRLCASSERAFMRCLPFSNYHGVAGAVPGGDVAPSRSARRFRCRHLGMCRDSDSVPSFALDAPYDVFECDADLRTNPSSRHPEAAPMPGGSGRRDPRSGSREPSRPGSLRRELLARELDLVGEDDELLAAVEAHGEERAADVLAERDESPRRGSANDAAPERDRARRAAACPWKDRHGCSVRC